MNEEMLERAIEFEEKARILRLAATGKIIQFRRFGGEWVDLDELELVNHSSNYREKPE